MGKNEVLRDAINAAGLTLSDIATHCAVDPKTVERWVSRGRIPHPRHRVHAAAAVGKDVEVLWPETLRRRIKTGADREVVGVYPRRSDMPRALFGELMTRAERRLWFGGYTSYFVWLDVPDAAKLLAAKADQGADVRFLLGDPDSPLTAKRDRIEATPLTLPTRIAVTQAELSRSAPAVPVRLSDRHLAMSVWIFDDDVIVATHIGAGLGQESVTLHLRRRQPGGAADRYTEHFEHLWVSAAPPRPIEPATTLEH